MKPSIVIPLLVVGALIACFSNSVTAESKSGVKPPLRVLFFDLGGTAPQTPEEFDEAARGYVLTNKISFDLEEAATKVVVHFSNTNAPIAVEYWRKLHYLIVDFDRDGKPLRHRQGIQYVR